MKNILDIASEITAGDRPSVYGPALNDYECTAAIWTALLRKANPQCSTLLVTPELAVTMMAALKLSRFAHVAVSEVLQGAVTDKHMDSLIDGAGYIRMAQIIQEQRKAREFLDSREETDPDPGAGLDECTECGGIALHFNTCRHWVCPHFNIDTCPHPDCKTHGQHVVKRGGPVPYGNGSP